MPGHNSHRRNVRGILRRTVRGLNRSCLRGRRRGPDDLSQALTAFGRAIRAHRRLARLAPRFFDAAVIDRERENRAERRRWMALWEPMIAKIYGVEPQPPTADDELPPLPPPRTERAVDLQLAELESWLAAGQAAFDRYQRRQPHALPSLSRLARWLRIACDFKQLVLGLDSKNPLPEKITYDYEFTDLKRAYGGETKVGGANAGDAASFPKTGGAVESGAASFPASRPETAADSQVSAALAPASDPPVQRRCDAWSRWARLCRVRQQHGK